MVSPLMPDGLSLSFVLGVVVASRLVLFLMLLFVCSSCWSVGDPCVVVFGLVVLDGRSALPLSWWSWTRVCCCFIVIVVLLFVIVVCSSFWFVGDSCEDAFGLKLKLFF